MHALLAAISNATAIMGQSRFRPAKATGRIRRVPVAERAAMVVAVMAVLAAVA